MAATWMAGRVMNADGGRGGQSGRRLTASVLPGCRRLGAGAFWKDAGTGPWSPDPHGPAEAGWCAGRYRLPARVWHNCGEPGAGLRAYEYRPFSRPGCRPAPPSFRFWAARNPDAYGWE